MCFNPKGNDRIRQNHASDLKTGKSMNYFNQATNKHGFLLIDLETNDESLKYRMNLDMCIIELAYTQ